MSGLFDGDAAWTGMRTIGGGMGGGGGGGGGIIYLLSDATRSPYSHNVDGGIGGVGGGGSGNDGGNGDPGLYVFRGGL